MKSAKSFVDEAIPHEAGHIVVGMAVGMPIAGLEVHVVVSAQGKKIGDFATKSLEPSDEQIPKTPPSVLKDYKLFLAGGLAGNEFAGIPASNESLQNDRLKLARVGADNLEAMSEMATEIIKSDSQKFGRLTSLIRERFLALMADPTLQSGRYTLISQQDLRQIFS